MGCGGVGPAGLGSVGKWDGSSVAGAFWGRDGIGGACRGEALAIDVMVGTLAALCPGHRVSYPRGSSLVGVRVPKARMWGLGSLGDALKPDSWGSLGKNTSILNTKPLLNRKQEVIGREVEQQIGPG